MDRSAANAEPICSRRALSFDSAQLFSFVRTGLFCAYFFTALIALAQGPIRLPTSEGNDVRFTHVTFGYESSHGRIAQIVQDNQGFLWLGTQDGLQRYDGYRLREYRHDPNNPNSLSGSYIYSLFKDRAGQLWVGSNQYLDRLNPATEIFTHFRLPAANFEGWISHITEDRAGTLWLSTNHGLNRLDPATGQTIRYQHGNGDPMSLSSDAVRATLEGKDGTFWVATTASLDIFDRRLGKVTQHFPLPVRPGSERPHSEISLCEDHTGTIWVAFSFADGLASVDRGRNELIYYSFGADTSDTATLPGMRTIYEDEDGTLWLGTANNGVLQLDRQRHHFVRYRNQSNDPASLVSDQVVAMYEDHEGNMWVGTTGGGVDRFQRKPLPFTRYQHELGNPNSLASNYTSAIFVDRLGVMWVGSVSELTRVDRKTGKFAFYRNVGGVGDLSSTWVVSVAEDSYGDLWFGTIDGGLNRFDPRNGKFKAYRHSPADPHSLIDDTVLGLLIDHKGALWAATENGLCRFDPQTDKFQEFKSPGEGRIRYRALAEDSDGSLWLGTLETGLRKLDTVTGKFTIYRGTGAPGSLRGNQVNAVHVDHSGTVWAGTEEGLNRFDTVSHTFTTYTQRDGLPSAFLNSILEDATGNLWIGTSGGLSQFDPNKKIFKNYYLSDGLAGDEFYNYASAYKSPTGEMFFNSYAGVVSFFPDKMMEKTQIPSVVLTDFLLFGKQVSFAGNSPLQQPINSTASIILSHRQSIFSLEFSALSFANPERVRYRYKLEGLETDWNETDSSRRSATYTTLAPGTYIFRVQARLNRGRWSEKGAALRIVVLPPWWGTWWFRAIVGLLLLAAIWSVYHERVRRLKRRNRELALEETRLREHTLELDRRVKERTAQLESSNKELEMFSYSISHDLRAPLRHVSGFAALLGHQYGSQLDSKASDYIMKIQRSAKRMGQMVDELLELSRCGRAALQLAPTDLAKLVEEARAVLCADCEGREIEWKIAPLPVLACDRTLMLMVFQNLLSNAIKFTRHSTSAIIEVGQTAIDSRAAIFVRDNGVGFDVKYVDKLFGVFQRLHRADEFEGTGVGLATAQRIVSKHGGEIWAQSELDKGTTFFFTLEGMGAKATDEKSNGAAQPKKET